MLTRLQKKVADWKSSDMTKWLSYIGQSKYEEAFKSMSPKASSMNSCSGQPRFQHHPCLPMQRLTQTLLYASEQNKLLQHSLQWALDRQPEPSSLVCLRLQQTAVLPLFMQRLLQLTAADLYMMVETKADADTLLEAIQELRENGVSQAACCQLCMAHCEVLTTEATGRALHVCNSCIVVSPRGRTFAK